MIETVDEAKEVFAEIWAWSNLASVFAEGVRTGKYPDSPGLAKLLTEYWEARIKGLNREFKDWLIRLEVSDEK